MKERERERMKTQTAGWSEKWINVIKSCNEQYAAKIMKTSICG